MSGFCGGTRRRIVFCKRPDLTSFVLSVTRYPPSVLRFAGTVAFVTGLRSVSNPWGSLVSWFQNAWVTASRYDLLQDTIRIPTLPPR